MDRVTDSKPQQMWDGWRIVDRWAAWCSSRMTNKEEGVEAASEITRFLLDMFIKVQRLEFLEDQRIADGKRMAKLEDEIDHLRAQAINRSRRDASDSRSYFDPGVEPMPSTQAPHGGL